MTVVINVAYRSLDTAIPNANARTFGGSNNVSQQLQENCEVHSGCNLRPDLRLALLGVFKLR